MARKDSQSSADSEEDWKEGDNDDETADGDSDADEEESLLDDVPVAKTAKVSKAPVAKAPVKAASKALASSSSSSPSPSSTAPKKKIRTTILYSDSDEDMGFKENKLKANIKPPIASPPKKSSPPTAAKQKAVTVVAPPRPMAASTSATTAAASSSSSSSSSSTSAAITAASDANTSVDITRGPNITTESRAKELILQYMKQQNRPYSSIQVYDNLHHRISKPFVDKCLASLSEGEGSQLLMKQYGKASIFFFNQLLIPAIKAGEMDRLESDISKLKNSMKESAATAGALAKTLGDLAREPTDNDLDAVLATLQSRTKEKQSRLNMISTCNLDPNALYNAKKALAFFTSEHKKRRANCLDAVDALAEGMNKKRKVLMGDLGLEEE